MSKGFAGGVAAVVALVAIFYFAPAPQPVPAPAPQPAPVVITKPVPTVQKPAPKKVIYYRVEQGGRRGPEVPCTDVKSFAEGKSPAELAVVAKQYAASVDEVKRWYVCE